MFSSRFFAALLCALLYTFPVSAQSSLAAAVANKTSETTEQNADEVLKPLLDTLKDETARQKLIDALEQKNNGGNDQNPDDARDADDQSRPSVGQSVAAKFAALTLSYSESMVRVGQNFVADVSAATEAMAAATMADIKRLFSVFLPLLLTILATSATFLVLERLAGPFLRKVKTRPSSGNVIATLVLIGSYTLASLVALIAAYALGQFLAATYFNTPAVSVYQALYLNAFAIFGVASIAIRLLTGIVDGTYPLIKVGPNRQNILRRRSVTIAGILVYGIAFVVPVLNAYGSFALGRGLRVIIFTVAAFMAWSVVKRLSHMPSFLEDKDSGDGVVESSPNQQPPQSTFSSENSARDSQSFLSRYWPIVAYIYIIFAYIVALARPDLFVDFVGGATLKTVAALTAGALVLRLFSHISVRQIPAPQFLPLDSEALSARLSSMAPIVLRALYVVIIVGIAAVVLDAWMVVDVMAWVSTGAGANLLSGIIGAFFVLVAMALIWAFGSSWIDYKINSFAANPIDSARSRTLYSLLRNALTIALIIFGGMIALSELGVDIGPLIAGAGVLGLAIGFGAQKLVQDIISGVFIQLENAMNVGDVVEVGAVTGTVERLTLRSVSIRDVQGVYHIIPFSSVDKVANYMRVFSYHVEVVGIAYKEDVKDGKDALEEAFARLLDTEFTSDIIAPLEMHGVTALGDSAVNLRVRIKTLPGKQFALGRAYTELVKQVMDERNIEIPFPHTTMFMGRDKQGHVDQLVVETKSTSSKSKPSPKPKKRATKFAKSNSE